MTDIVEELMVECGSRWGDEDDHRLEKRAADEIVKLRKGWLDQAARDAAEIVRLEIEIKRLNSRVALLKSELADRDDYIDSKER